MGHWFSRFTGAAGGVRRFAERRKESVTARRAAISGKLKQLEHPIVVVVDDIDRLTTPEIRDMFKLVRLTASFPNVIYVLVFDRKRVEHALGEHGISGRSYLEKIVQVGLDVPAPPKGVLIAQTVAALNEAIGDVQPQRFDPNRWQDVLAEIIAPLITNMRDVRRYVSSARMTVRSMAAEVEAVDLLGLEAVRIFLPEVFEKLVAAQVELTDTSGGLRTGSGDGWAVQAAIDAAGERAQVANAIVDRLFPAGERYLPHGTRYTSDWRNNWMKARRVAHPDVLSYYLEHTLNEGLLTFSDAERAVTVLADHSALDDFLRSLDRNRLDEVITALEAWEQDYSLEAVVPASTVLLNLWPELPDKPRGMMDFFDARLIVIRVVLRLLRRIEDEGGRLAAVDDILSGLHRLSSKVELIQTVGHRENVGHKLIPEEAAQRLQQAFAASVDAATPEDLAGEHDLMRVLLEAKRWNPGSEAVFRPKLADSRVSRVLLLQARTETRSQTMGTRAVQRAARLRWDILVELMGDQDAVRLAVEALRAEAATNDQVAELVSLADRYLSGWRPRDDD